MPFEAVKVKIATPTGPIPSGRGFYQLEEETLYLPIEHGLLREHFFSFLESRDVCLQLDREGRLIFIEVSIPRRRWQFKEDLVSPEEAEPADIRFLNFRQLLPEIPVYCDYFRQNLLLRFGRGSAAHNYYLAENLIAQCSADDHLLAIWVSRIDDDLAGKECAAWRKMVRREQPAPIPVQP